MAQTLMTQAQYNQVIQARQGSYNEASAQWISHELYDTLVIPATANTLSFFQVPIGGVKGLTKTNMKQGGQLPVNQNFRFNAVEISFINEVGGAAADLDTNAEAAIEVLQNTAWQFVIDGREYDLQFAGAALLPAMMHFSAANISASAGRMTSKGEYKIGAKINLGGLTSFGMNVNFTNNAAVVARLAVLNAAGCELQVRLSGELLRKIA